MEYNSAIIKNKMGGFCELSQNFGTLDIGKIKYGSVQKLPNYGPHLAHYERPFIPFYYEDEHCRTSALTFLMPYFVVHSWDVDKGRLELAFYDGESMARIQQLQHFVLKSVINHQKEWLGVDHLTYEAALDIFQPFIQHDRFVIYLPNAAQKKQIWTHDHKGWSYGTTAASFMPGMLIRPIVKMQGLCFILNDGKMKFRIQHQTLTVFHKMVGV
jgi:hypothetical protein